MNNEQIFPSAYYDQEADSRGELVHHLKLKSSDIGSYVFMPGDPKRCKKIASYFDDAKFVAEFREYATYTGYLDGVKVSVVSHGIGGPSAAIALEELIKLGAHTFIRIGTAGGMQTHIIPGEVVVVNGAIRADSTPNSYIPREVPAVPSFAVLKALVEGAKNAGVGYHVGTVHCKDSFYGQHSPETMAVKDLLLSQWESYIATGAIASEMESATMFAVAMSKGVRAGAVMLIAGNQERRKLGHNEYVHNTENAIRVAVEGLKHLIKQDKKQHG